MATIEKLQSRQDLDLDQTMPNVELVRAIFLQSWLNQEVIILDT